MLITPPQNTTAIYPVPSDIADKCLGVIYILCSLVGLPLNIASLCFFTQQRKQALRNSQGCEILRDHTLIFNTIYLTIICTDISILSTSFPVAEGFLRSRNPAVFSNNIFCTTWGILWNVLPFFSVFLVLTMSTIRSVILMKPRIRIPRGRVTCCILVYMFLLVTRGAVSLFLEGAQYVYTASDQYCWESRESPLHELTQLTIAGTLLALPILPIIISCLVSVFLLSRHMPRRASSQSSNSSHSNIQQHASITVTMVTLVYIVLNLPSFINYSVYVDLRVRGGEMIERYSSSFLWNYSWNVTYVLCVTLNSCVNPVVYLLRNRSYQRAAERRCRDILKSRGAGSNCSGVTKQTIVSDTSTSKL